MNQETVVRQEVSSRPSPLGWVALHSLGTVIVIANLAATQETKPWMWALYGCTVALWPAYLVLDFHDSRFAWWPLAFGAVLNAAVEGWSPDITAMLFAAVYGARLAALPTIRLWAAMLTPLVMTALTVASDVLTGHTERMLDRGGTVFLVCVVGLGIRQFRAQSLAARQLLEQTRRTQAEQARAAALDERTRIAREIHDVLAHSLGALGMQLEVAEAMLTDGGSTEEATRRVSRARRLAAEGLTEARSAVAALRGEVPPIVDSLTEMAEAHANDHDVRVDSRATGEPRVLEASVTVALLRAAREALTNAAKHAPAAPIRLELVFTEQEVILRVSNESGEPARESGPGGGHGLTGMAERIALLGGELRAGPDERGWTVTVRVPA